MSIGDPYQNAIDHWKRRGVSLLPPANEVEIERTFADLNHPLSNDIRRLYLVTGGFEGEDCDGVWCLWSLDRILEENKERESPLLWFADYMISAHVYAFRYTSPESSAVYIDHNSDEHAPYEVTESVGGFLQKYLDDPETVEAGDFYFE